MSEFKTLDLVKVVNQNRYGLVDFINLISNEVRVIFVDEYGRRYANYKTDEIVRVGECNCFDNTLIEGDIVRIKAVDNPMYNAIARVAKLDLFNTPSAVVEIFDNGYSTRLTKQYTYQLDMLEQYILLEDISYEDTEIEVDDLVLINETGEYGYVNLIKEDISRVCYYDVAVGKVCNYFYNNNLTLVGKLKENVNDVRVSDIVIINNKDYIYNNYFGKVVYTNDKFAKIDIYNSQLDRVLAKNMPIDNFSLLPYRLVDNSPLANLNDKEIEQVTKEAQVEQSKENNLKQSTDTSGHYAHQIQPIEYIQSIMEDLPVTGFEGACIKDIIKYCSRFGLKDDKEKEAKKILDYALWLFMDTQKLKINPRLDNHESIKKFLIYSRN